MYTGLLIHTCQKHCTNLSFCKPYMERVQNRSKTILEFGFIAYYYTEDSHVYVHTCVFYSSFLFNSLFQNSRVFQIYKLSIHAA